ncbi:MAG: AmmeMemoRadiSam system protein A [Phycisphaeraceae bacterium]|nr:AmmeMemoRadiSam system protein A [Phycisphaeraceae bacterium]
MSWQTENDVPLIGGDGELLLRLARDSVAYGLEEGEPLPVDPTEFPEALRQVRATFVTLHLDGDLRGCIGVLQAARPLVVDVAQNAFAAAFQDPRFPPVTRPEAQKLTYHVSILSPPTPLTFTDQQGLLRQIRPGVDGLILEDGRYRGTFLPAVWESLPQPDQFLMHLKMKAGLPPDYWSPTLRVQRYTCQSISD